MRLPIRPQRTVFRTVPSIVCSGDYANWSDALAASTGYYLPEFIERTRQAALKVKSGEAVYERDSVLFDRIQHSFPLLAVCLRAALEQNGALTVFDFGGGLGTSYCQCRTFLAPIRSLRWLIVDQPALVDIGLREFQSDELKFFPTIADAVSHRRPNVLLLSGVLPYVPAPYDLLAQLLPHAISDVIVDRTLFLARDQDRLTIQHGPAEIYPGTYPAWFLGESRLLKVFAAHGYDLQRAFDGFDEVGPEDEAFYPKGFIFRRSA